MKSITCTKSFRDFPAAHRQPNHDGHCALVHGHNWDFDISFQARVLDGNGFVLDVGKLDFVKRWLTDHFDHTLLLNVTDPQLGLFAEMEKNGLAKVVIVPNCGMEGLANYVLHELQEVLSRSMEEDVFQRGLRITSITVWEDSKNRATYTP